MSTKFRRQYKRRSIAKARLQRARLARLAASQSDFLTGFLSGLDLTGALAPSIRDLYEGLSIDEVDSYAIGRDWELVGQDLYAVLNDRERRRQALRSSASS